MQLWLESCGANNSRGGCAHQLGAHRVGRLERALVQEVVVAPVRGLVVLLECVVHIQERQVVPCSHTSHNAANKHRLHNRNKSTIAKAMQQSTPACEFIEAFWEQWQGTHRRCGQSGPWPRPRLWLPHAAAGTRWGRTAWRQWTGSRWSTCHEQQSVELSVGRRVLGGGMTSGSTPSTISFKRMRIQNDQPKQSQLRCKQPQ